LINHINYKRCNECPTWCKVRAQSLLALIIINTIILSIMKLPASS
jgi:hypothetical protein